jgi:hypothetical protein
MGLSPEFWCLGPLVKGAKMLRLKATVPSLVLCAAMLSFCGSAGAATLVTNGGFETGDLTGWTQTGQSAFLGVQCPGAGLVPGGSCDLFAGPVGSVGGIQQTLATTLGGEYIVSFAFEPDGGVPSSFSALFGGVTLVSLPNPAASSFVNYSFDVFASGASTVLAFNFRDDPGFLFLDNVSVTPLPAALPLFTGGLGLIGLLARRRKKKNAPSA